MMHHWDEIIDNRYTLLAYWQDIAGYYLDNVTGKVWRKTRTSAVEYVLEAETYEEYQRMVNAKCIRALHI